jgi:hypothetical protein
MKRHIPKIIMVLKVAITINQFIQGKINSKNNLLDTSSSEDNAEKYELSSRFAW